MDMKLLVAVAGALAAGFGGTSHAQSGSPAEAKAVFQEARAICERDAGALWDQSLCGPILLVNWKDRSALANHADGVGALTEIEPGVFSGKIPDSQVLANTPVEWAGKRWTQLVWPLPEDEAERRVLLAHELFHRIQPELGLARSERGNRHLDTLEGRYLLQLEWRALERAIVASTQAASDDAVDDALTFRQARYELFPNAVDDEAALQINEGVPEYTGVRLGLTTPQARSAFAVRNLEAFLTAPTFIRSFAYASGPAYGLLLDNHSPAWKDRVRAGARIDTLLAEATGWRADPARPAQTRASEYDIDGALRAFEEAREAGRLRRVAEWKARLVEGPVLSIALGNANFQFNPQTLQALDDIGTVYPTMRTTDAWGVLVVENGALLSADRKTVIVPAIGLDAQTGQGDGWKITLNDGWSVVAGDRPGDFTLAGPNPVP